MENKKIVLNVRSQKAYDSLMNKLDNKGYLWVTDRIPTEMDFWYKNGRNTIIIINVELEAITYDMIDNENKDLYPLIKVFKPNDKLENYL